MTKFNTIAAAAIAASLAFAGTAAQADDITVNEQGLPTISVSLADLNLDTASGAQAAEARIDRAAGKVCGESNNAVSMSEKLHVRDCIANARGEAQQLLAQRTRGQVMARVSLSSSPR